MLKTILKLISLLLLLATAFVAYSAFTMTGDMISGNSSQLQQQLQNPEGAQKVIQQGRKAISTVIEVAEPVLSKLGVDVKGKYSDDSDEITRRLQEVSSAVNDATKAINGTR